MKTNKTSNPVPANGQSPVRIQLEFIHPTATTVHIAGTFNDWRPAATPMILFADGHWRKELALPPGKYEYRFVADGEWVPDPAAAATAPNPFGGMNSILEVGRERTPPNSRPQ